MLHIFQSHISCSCHFLKILKYYICLHFPLISGWPVSCTCVRFVCSHNWGILLSEYYHVTQNTTRTLHRLANDIIIQCTRRWRTDVVMHIYTLLFMNYMLLGMLLELCSLVFCFPCYRKDQLLITNMYQRPL